MEQFQDCVSICGMEDLKATGAMFTWSNKQEPGDKVYSRLDIVMGNQHWMENFNDYMWLIYILKEACIYDHSPVTVNVLQDKKVVKKFSFINSWIEQRYYLKTVQEAWKTNKFGSLIFCLFDKLKSVKHDLTNLHKNYFSNITSRVKTAKDKLLKCQRDLKTNYIGGNILG
ncbi:hypothetical protein KSS87_000020 [Heliosperma pusillum]|nr:hypothetical protein KSS87_000020 [Heliosperma pusillum]